jgi:hypothetical protein
MCQHCETLLSLIPLLQCNNASIERISLYLDEIRATHKFRAHTRKSSATIPLAKCASAIQSSAYAFYALPSQPTFNKLCCAIKAYWVARLRANDARKANTINPDGQPEPLRDPRVHRIPDCWIHDKESVNPAHIHEQVNFARHVITCNNRYAERAFARAERMMKRDNASEAARVERSFAHDAIHRSNCIEYQLSEYRSIHNIRR